MMAATVCSGIGAPETAMPHWQWQFCAEIEPFPSAVLAHHYPHVPNRGDMTKFKEWPDAAIDVLVGGTPCQSFSVAGLRKGLDDPRGNLALVFLALADRYRPEWVVWENVPGVLSSSGGRDFGAFLGGLGELGYGWAYRCLDAQWFGLAQRRKRVFVVGHLGDWRRAASVLFEPEGLRGDSAPSREAGQGVAGNLSACPGTSRKHGHGWGQQEWESGYAIPVLASGAHGSNGAGVGQEGDPEFSLDTCGAMAVAHSLRGEGFDASEDGTGRGTPLVPVPIDMRQASRGDKITNNRPEGTSGGAPGHGIGDPGDPAFTVSERGQAIAFDTTQITSAANYSKPKAGDPCHPLASGAHAPAVAYHTSGNCGALETGDKTDALTTGTDPNSHVLVYGIRSDASRDGEALTPSADAEGRVRLRNPGMGVYEELSPTVDASQPHSVAFQTRGSNLNVGEIAGTIGSNADRASGGAPMLQQSTAVRRLTPVECERLMGFSDGYTAITYRGKPAADGNRYKALGNSMATTVVGWILRRIELAHAVTGHLEAAE